MVPEKLIQAYKDFTPGTNEFAWFIAESDEYNNLSFEKIKEFSKLSSTPEAFDNLVTLSDAIHEIAMRREAAK